MEYQGFNGNNFEEDDEQRKKAGGFVNFSGSRVPVSPDVLKNEYTAALERILNANTNKRSQFEKMDETRNAIMRNQNRIDAGDQDPQLLEEQERLEQQMIQNPDSESFMDEKQQLDVLKKQEKFKKISDLFNK